MKEGFGRPTDGPAIDSLAIDDRLDSPPGRWVGLVAAVAARLLPLRARPGPVRRLLVVRTDDRVGNALLTLPLVRALQAALPGAQIDLLLAARRLPLLAGLPSLTLIPFDKRALFTRPLQFLRTLAALRRTRYDVAIDAAHWHAFSLTSALLARWAGRSAVVGSARGPASLYSATAPLPPRDATEVEAKVALLAGLGLSPPRSPPRLETGLGRSPTAVAWCDAALAGAGPGPFAALNPGGRKADHRWPPERLGALAQVLAAREGLPSLVVWGPGEEVLARQVVAGSGGAARLAPPSDLDQLAAIFRRAALVVTNDTGPMHLAVACGAAVLALLLSRDGARWSHRGPAFAGVPVSADGGGREAGASDELEQVAAAARSLLAARGVDAARAPASR